MNNTVVRFLLGIVLVVPPLARGQFSSEILSLMAEAQRVAASGNLADVTALAVRNPGFVKEITQSALQAMPGNRAGVIAAMLQAMPNRGAEVAMAAAKGAPASFAAELTQILAGRPAGEVIAIAAKVAAAEPKTAVTTARVACAAAPEQAPNIAAVIVPSVPQEAGAVVVAAISGSNALKNRMANEAGAVAGAIAAAAAKQVPAQAANIVQGITQAQGLLGFGQWLDAAALLPGQVGSVFVTRFLAITATAVVQSVPSSMNSVLAEVAKAGQANNWVAPYNSSGVNLAYSTGLLLSSLNPSEAPQIVSILSSLPGGAEASRSLVRTDLTSSYMQGFTPELQAVAAATKSAQVAVAQGSNVPATRPAMASSPTSSSSAPTTPALPIDPTLVVSPSR